MGQAEDEAAIRQMAVDYVEAWREHTGEAFARPFAVDADFTSIRGIRCHGRDEIASAHDHLFKAVFPDTHVDSEIVSIRFLRPDVAAVELRSAVYRNSDGEKVSGGLPQWIVTKKGGRWEIAVFRNMVPAERHS
ncbi:MAG: SgcJ/EcaC family oxidoreductase [Chloroflexi bacterium]|nr:SgcJ/EcaC family oxidoreductase [Chloroflexota bacterium]